MRTRGNIALWILYDFANSIVSIVFFLYFAQWAVIDAGVTDFLFNLTFTASAALLLLTVPVSGVLLDTSWRRITGLRYSTACTAIFYGSCAGFAIVGHERTALLFFMLGLYAYLFSFTFYTPLINDIAPPARHGLVSGLGIAANYVGQFAGLLIALPFANGTVHLFGSSPRAETLLPSVVIFLLMALPMLLFFKESAHQAEPLSMRQATRTVFRETKRLFMSPGVALFLASYFLFNDAILTASNNFPIVLEQVWHIPDTVKTYLLLGVLVTSALGGLGAGFVADRFGQWRTLLVILAGWVLFFPVLGLLTNFFLFILATVFMGLWFGAVWAVSRSVMAAVAPAGRHNLAFAYFGLAERAASFVGPVVWGLIVSHLTSMGSVRYRIALFAMTVFVFLGFIALGLMRKYEEKTH